MTYIHLSNLYSTSSLTTNSQTSRCPKRMLILSLTALLDGETQQFHPSFKKLYFYDHTTVDGWNPAPVDR